MTNNDADKIGQVDKALAAISRKVLLDVARMDPDVRVRYSYMFCEVCERNYRQLLVKFDDGSVFTLCKLCTEDLRDIVELFALDCAISPL